MNRSTNCSELPIDGVSGRMSRFQSQLAAHNKNRIESQAASEQYRCRARAASGSTTMFSQPRSYRWPELLKGVACRTTRKSQPYTKTRMTRIRLATSAPRVREEVVSHNRDITSIGRH